MSSNNPASMVMVSLLPRLPIITCPVAVTRFAMAVAPFPVVLLKVIVGVLVGVGVIVGVEVGPGVGVIVGVAVGVPVGVGVPPSPNVTDIVLPLTNGTADITVCCPIFVGVKNKN